MKHQIITTAEVVLYLNDVSNSTNGRTKILSYFLVAIFLGITFSSFSQTESPTLRIFQSDEEIKSITKETDTEVNTFGKDSTLYFSNFSFDRDGYCDKQEFYFVGVTTEWVKHLFTTEMGFFEQENTLIIREIQSGCLLAEIDSTTIISHGGKESVKATITANQWMEQPEFPTIRILQTKGDIKRSVGEEDIEANICENDDVLYVSFFDYADNICVKQSIIFSGVSEFWTKKAWVKTLLTKEMGFAKKNDAFIKHTSAGYLVAELLEYNDTPDLGDLTVEVLVEITLHQKSSTYGNDSPPVRISLNKVEIKSATSDFDVEVNLCTKEEVMYHSYFEYTGADSICAEQNIVFTGKKKSWVKNLLTKEMGFVKTDSLFTKLVPLGYLTAEIKKIKEREDHKEVSTGVLISFSEGKKDSDILNTLAKGSWEGTGYQFNTHEDWPMKLLFDKADNTFKIEYPSLNCSGYWKATNVTNSEIEFTEIITRNRDACVNGGKVVLKLLEESRIEYSFYFPDHRTLDSKGEIQRTIL